LLHQIRKLGSRSHEMCRFKFDADKQLHLVVLGTRKRRCRCSTMQHFLSTTNVIHYLFTFTR